MSWSNHLTDLQAYTAQGQSILDRLLGEKKSVPLSHCLPLELRALLGLEAGVTTLQAIKEHSDFTGAFGDNPWTDQFVPSKEYMAFLQSRYSSGLSMVFGWHTLSLKCSPDKIYFDKRKYVFTELFSYLAKNGIDFSVKARNYQSNSKYVGHYRMGLRYDEARAIVYHFSEKEQKLDVLLADENADRNRQGVELLESLGWEYKELCEYFGLNASSTAFEVYQRFYSYPNRWVILSYFWSVAQTTGIEWAQDIDGYFRKPWSKPNAEKDKMYGSMPSELVPKIERAFALFQDDVVFVTTTGQLVLLPLDKGIELVHTNAETEVHRSILSELSGIDGLRDKIDTILTALESSATYVETIRVSPYTNVYHSIVTWEELLSCCEGLSEYGTVDDLSGTNHNETTVYGGIDGYTAFQDSSRVLSLSDKLAAATTISIPNPDAVAEKGTILLKGYLEYVEGQIHCQMEIEWSRLVLMECGYETVEICYDEEGCDRQTLYGECLEDGMDGPADRIVCYVSTGTEWEEAFEVYGPFWEFQDLLADEEQSFAEAMLEAYPVLKNATGAAGSS